MPPKMGRPTDDPKTNNTRIRLSDDDVLKLNYCAQTLAIKKADVIRMGIREIYDRLKEKE